MSWVKAELLTAIAVPFAEKYKAAGSASSMTGR